MNDPNNSTAASREATRAYWCEKAADFETALERLRLLVGVASDLCEPHPEVSHLPGQITMRAETFFQLSTLLETISASAKQALGATR